MRGRYITCDNGLGDGFSVCLVYPIVYDTVLYYSQKMALLKGESRREAALFRTVSGIDSSQLDWGGLMRLFLFLIPHGFFLHTPAGSKSKLAVL